MYRSATTLREKLNGRNFRLLASENFGLSHCICRQCGPIQSYH